MKELNYILLSQIEPGDRLRMQCGDYHRQDWEGPRDFEITVSRKYNTHNFGPVIVSMERITTGQTPEEDELYPTLATEDTWYTNDEWIMTHIESGMKVYA